MSGKKRRTWMVARGGQAGRQRRGENGRWLGAYLAENSRDLVEWPVTLAVPLDLGIDVPSPGEHQGSGRLLDRHQLLQPRHTDSVCVPADRRDRREEGSRHIVVDAHAPHACCCRRNASGDGDGQHHPIVEHLVPPPSSVPTHDFLPILVVACKGAPLKSPFTSRSHSPFRDPNEPPKQTKAPFPPGDPSKCYP